MNIIEKDIWQQLSGSDSPVVIYGTGNGADKILDEFERRGISVSAVTASDDHVRCQTFRGFSVRSIGDAAKEFSDMILVPSEQVSVINTLGRTLSYQTPVDYEMFLDAPAVSKAVRRLKRAKKKLMSLFPDIKTGNDFISLIPAGWTQIISQQSRQMPGSDLYNTEDLGFSGDSYGESFCPDENIARSVEKICSNFS